MKYLLLLILALPAFSEDAAPEPAAPRAPALTDNDLQNLIACARITLQSLTPDQIAAVAQAIKHAEADLEASKKAKAIPVEIKKP